MGIAIICPGRDVTSWIQNIQKLEPSINVQVYPDISDYSAVEAVMVWQQPKGILHEFPNLKLICSMGAGVDHILGDDSIPEHIPITRIVDEKLMVSMTTYVVMAVLTHQRQLDRYIMQQEQQIWDMSNPELDCTIGIMGVGELGNDIAEKLMNLGYQVIGYGNSPKSDTAYPYYNATQLDEFLSKVNVLVCMLPLTPKTENILNMGLFEKCRQGTYLINVARGRHLVEEDLLEALSQGFLSGAMLDVFRTEPLPESHPFWKSEKIRITPHIASVTNPDAATPQILENYRRIRNNEPLNNQINRLKGY
jgi:glyoxylate/hydroxypyruvate reductase